MKATKEKKQLTKAEMQVMDILWRLATDDVSSGDVMREFPEPKPATTTLLTFLKILTEKDFVQTVKQGKTLRFTPLVSRDEYTRHYMTEVKNTFFGGSLTSLVSFFVRNEKLSSDEAAELMDIIQNETHL